MPTDPGSGAATAARQARQLAGRAALRRGTFARATAPQSLVPPSQSGPRTAYRGLTLAVVLTIALEAIIVSRAVTLSVDGTTFITIAQQLAADPIGTFRTADQHPGYPALVLAATHAVQAFGYTDDPGSWIAGARLVSCVCGVLSVVVMWLFARCLFDVRVANISAIALAVLPLMRRNASDAMSDTPHMLLYLLAAWLACEGLRRQRARLLAAAGAASGLAYWIRPEGLEIALVTAGVIVLHGLWTRAAWKQWSGQLACLCAATLAVATPYLLLAGKVTSKQLPFAKQQEVELYVVRQVREAAAIQTVGSGAEVKTRSVFGRVLISGLNEFAKSMGQGFKFAFLPFYFLGHVALYRRRPNWWLVLTVALYGILHVVVLQVVYFMSGYVDHRHVIPIMMMCLPFTALGIVYVGERLHHRMPLGTSPRGWVAAVLVTCCALVMWKNLRPMNAEFQPVVDAARWVRERAGPGTGVVTNSAYVPFYSRLPGAVLAPATPNLEAALGRAPQADYSYAVLHVDAYGYHSEWLDQLGQRYRPLFELQNPAPGFEHTKVIVFAARRPDVAQRQP